MEPIQLPPPKRPPSAEPIMRLAASVTHTRSDGGGWDPQTMNKIGAFPGVVRIDAQRLDQHGEFTRAIYWFTSEDAAGRFVEHLKQVIPHAGYEIYRTDNP